MAALLGIVLLNEKEKPMAFCWGYGGGGMRGWSSEAGIINCLFLNQEVLKGGQTCSKSA